MLLALYRHENWYASRKSMSLFSCCNLPGSTFVVFIFSRVFRRQQGEKRALNSEHKIILLVLLSYIAPEDPQAKLNRTFA